MIRKPFSHKSLQRTAAKSSQSDHPRQRSLHPIPALEVAHLQRAIGNRATARLIQRASIHPGEFFDGAQAGDEIQAGIQGNVLRGFGLDVNGRTWHTKLVFDPEHTPGAVGEEQMYPEGSGVRGVIGPDHPLGSEPNLDSAAENNRIAGFFQYNSFENHRHVAAHIVNDQLGGPGDEAQNLFAFPGTANTLMETQVESKMKKAVEDGHFIYYEAKVNHPDQGPARSITMSWNKLDRSGRDIGGGQSGVTINADNTASGNPSITEQSDETPAQHILLNPNHTFFIKRFPWGPFHMPDPKKEREVWGPFLDISWFPAVGNARAFEAFLNDYRNNNEAMDELCNFLGNEINEFTKALGEWIRDDSGIPIRRRGRGMNEVIVGHLVEGNPKEKKAAFKQALNVSQVRGVVKDWLAQIARSRL